MVEEEGRRAYVEAERKANEAFSRLAEVVQGYAERGEEIDVLEVARAADFEIDEGVLERLELDRYIFPKPWLPWHVWFPWRPWWCYWWRRHYPHYRCCPWWWYRCHYYRW